MKRFYLILSSVFIGILLAVTNLYSFPGDDNPESTTKTINYNIESYNKTGSFVVQLGGTENSQTGKFSGYVRVVDEKGKIIQEITPETLNKQIEKLEIVNAKFIEQKLDGAEFENIIVSLQEFKEILENEAKFRTLIEKIKAINTESGLPYSYVISTIRGQQETVSGTIE